ncbi:putative ubiquitin carboxyl-terminal hydrolase creB [Geopyxis carbonaria]|nr:putative ubiquitin carboxyl-terminal hydrolase creB [Geopyxis carbonaria]
MFKSIKNLPWIGDSSGSHPHPASPAKHKAEPQLQGLQGLIGDGPPRSDGSDRFFGMENAVGVRTEPPYGNTCYCNSILQCLYYSKPFRETVVNFPARGQQPYQSPTSNDSLVNGSGKPIVRVNTEPLPTTSAAALAAAKVKTVASPAQKDETKKKPLPAAALVQTPPPGQNENKDSPEYKKKKALENGPVLDIDQGNSAAYGMEESLYTALKDLFESIMANSSKTGIIKPSKFLEILRRENEMFNGQQHQDAHEFLNYVLNEVIENVEAHQRMLRNGAAIPPKPSGSLTGQDTASTVSTTSMASSAVSGWIHELFQGLLTSETKCLTCENVSRRDEHFLDLSIDLEKNSSVTSCLRNFSASEMLCERNKFHCDTCGGLQEAEKRMKIKRLPKVLALHLKRFKYMEQTSRFEKLHYRVLYPYHLRLFNTTDDADDPDRLYELYAVVVHIGGGPYHGHYVAIIKTEDKGWLLFDDEMVEPVDKAYVRNFFGERTGAGVASAYVLFYQETTFEAVQREMWADEQEAANKAAEATAKAEVPLSPKMGSPKIPNGITPVNGHALRPDTSEDDSPATIYPALSSPLPRSSIPHDEHRTPAAAAAEHPPIPMIKSKKEREREKREEKEREKAERKAAEKDKEPEGRSSMSRFRNTSRSLRQPPKWLGGRHRDGDKDKDRQSQHFSSEYPVEDAPLLTPGLPPTPGIPPTPTLPPLPPTPALPAELNERTAAPPIPVTPIVNFKENNPPPPVPPPKREKDEKKEKKEKEKGGSEKRRLHHHRPSLFGLRKKAQPTE